MIAEFAENVSVAHEQFANQIRNIVDSFAKKNNELKKEIPVEYPPCSLYTVWEELLRETQQDAEAHAETATLIAKNVCVPLVEISSHKKNESKQLCSYRDKFESLLQTGENDVEKCYKKYTEAYTTYENDETVSQLPLATYHSAHNDYLLQLEATNAQEDIYHKSVLPQMLQELEDIHTDLSTTLNNAFTSHCLLFSNKAKEQNRRFEDILNLCKNVNSKTDINVFLSSLHPEVLPYTAKHFTFSPPAQVDHTVSQWTLLDQRIIFQRHTEVALKSKELFLQKEAAALTSLLRNNEQTTLTLIRICQRIIRQHEREVVKTLRGLEKTTRKGACWKNHHHFNTCCLRDNVIPKSLHLRSTVKGIKASTILRKAEKKLLNIRISQCHFTVNKLQDEKELLEANLRTKLKETEMEEETAFIEHAHETTFRETQERQQRKYDQLLSKQQHGADSPQLDDPDNITESDKTIKILPADKGRATVIMKATDYDAKIAGLLGDETTYKKLERDPTKVYKSKLVNTMKEWKRIKTISDALYYRIYLTSEAVPKFYGLHKVHKNNVPSLFTSIPVTEAGSVIKDRLNQDTTLKDRCELSVNQIITLLEICLNTAYFIYDGVFYKQKFR
ncbi:hypothetical protein LSAT2_021120 [Lamellibrachia satsuma]|nr:hypothetical protein LSAT2_021120 [Lamellibrachia satsuma]